MEALSESSFRLSDLKRAQISSSFLHIPTPQRCHRKVLPTHPLPGPEDPMDNAFAGMPPRRGLGLFFFFLTSRTPEDHGRAEKDKLC